MKHFIALILVLLCSVAHGQTYTTVDTGNTGYVTIDGNNYPRGQVYTYYQVNRRGDTTLQLQLPSGTIAGKTAAYYLDGDNSSAAFRSTAALKVWMNAHCEQVETATGKLAAFIQFSIGDGNPGTPVAGTTTSINSAMNGKREVVELEGHGALVRNVDYTLHTGGGIDLISPAAFNTNAAFTILVFNP